MERALELSLLERVLAHVEARTTDLGPAGRAPVAAYVDPDRFAREVALLARLPRVVAPASTLPGPGSWRCEDTFGRPRLVTRNRQGELRAFVNACRHRGTRLVWEDSGQGPGAFVCPYHAWSYDGDGKLLGVPGRCGRDAFPDLEGGSRDLVALPAAEAGGLLWIADAPFEAEAWLGPLADEVEALGLGGCVPYRPRTRTWRANWKVLIDGALEAYHVQPTHRRSIARLFYDDLQVWDPLGPHARLLLPTRSVEALRTTPRDAWSLREHVNLVLHLFPAAALLVQPDHVMLVQIEPVAPAETRVTLTMLVPEEPRTPRARAHWDKNHELTHRALDEDFLIAERIQETLASGANLELVFGRNEPALAHFHAQLEAHLAAPG